MWRRSPWADSLPYLTYLGWCLLFGFAERVIAGAISFPADDAWIHCQFARNLARGQGFSFNPGEPVPGFSSASWVLLSALAFKLTGNCVISMRLLAVFCGLACIHVAGLFGNLLGGAQSRRQVQWTVANSPLLVSAAMTGLETVLFTYLVFLGFWWHWSQRDRMAVGSAIAGFLWGLASLTRLESLAFLGLLLIERMVSDRSLRSLSSSLVIALICFAVISPWLWFCYRLTGSPFPATFSAKAVAALRVTSLSYTLGVNLLALPLWIVINNPVAFLLFLQSLGLLWKSGQWREFRLAIVPFLFYLIRAFVHRWVAMNLYFTRYYLPTLLTPSFLCGPPIGRLKALTAIAPVGGLVGCVWALVIHGWMVQNTTTMQVAIGNWLRLHTGATSVIATNDVGAIAFFSERQIIDTMGLVTPDVTPAVYPPDRLGTGVLGAWEPALLEYLKSRRPDFLVVFPRWYPWLTSQHRLLKPLLTVRLQKNVICGDDTMTVYKFLWSEEKGPSKGTATVQKSQRLRTDNLPPLTDRQRQLPTDRER